MRTAIAPPKTILSKVARAVSIMRQSLFASSDSKPRLGRWNQSSSIAAFTKVDLNNEDHCGCCWPTQDPAIDTNNIADKSTAGAVQVALGNEKVK